MIAITVNMKYSQVVGGLLFRLVERDNHEMKIYFELALLVIEVAFIAVIGSPEHGPTEGKIAIGSYVSVPTKGEGVYHMFSLKTQNQICHTSHCIDEAILLNDFHGLKLLYKKLTINTFPICMVTVRFHAYASGNC